MGIFRNNPRPCRMVEYSCPPQVHGRLCMALGVLFIVFAVATLFAKSSDKLVATVILGLCAAGLFGHGAYCFRFRRRPFRREITLGSWFNSLYLRNKWLFLLTALGINLLSYAVGLFVVTLVFDGTDALHDTLTDKMRKWCFLLMILLLHTFHEFFNYYQYYRSPEYRRETAANTGATGK